MKTASLSPLVGVSDVPLSVARPRRLSRLVKLSPSSRLTLLCVFAAAYLLCLPSVGRAQTFGCSPAMANDIVCENSKPGSSPSNWQISGSGDSSIQGFATDISVNQGQTVYFKINTSASSYHLDIYRMGYYGGNGARLITTVNPSASLPQSQPNCLTNSTTRLYDCGNWAVSASWTVPSNATSGIYFAHLIRNDSGGDSQIFFIVRSDSSHSAVLFQTSDTSWQAYNAFGGNSLYGTSTSVWDTPNRAYKVSYNRPFNTFESITWVFGAEYPMVRWLEANGYDVTYFTDVDSDRNGSLIRNHKVFMSNSHDEYWSGGQRTNVAAARDAGVNLAFFSGNEVFWKTRWENSIDGSGTPYRTLVCYKETLSGSKTDPTSTWTGTWRDPTFSPPSDGGKPENSLTGTIFMVNGPASDNTGLSIKVPAADGKMRFWRNTSIANLSSGTATLPQGTLGYEWDADADNGSRPAGLIFLSTTTQNLTSSYLLDYGGVYGSGTATHHMTLYRAASGALVFGAGTVQWSWGLDSNHDNTFGFPNPSPSADMRQATVNLFADMGVQPATIQSGLLLATKSTDATPPVSTITSPASGATVTVGVQVTISGTASDGGGGTIGAVEVSVDGGQTWHPASGRASWTYPFTPTKAGSYTLKSRAVDDTANLETPGAGVTVSTPGVATFSVSGTISPSAAGSGATVTLSGASSATVTANSSGVYTFSGLVNGSFTVTPTKTGYSFSPASTAVTVSGANVTGVNFTGSTSSGTTYSISGSVTPAASGTGVTITVTGPASASTLTDASGNFSIPGLANGTYTVTPSKLNFAFSPVQSSVTITSANVTGVTFNAVATAQTLFTTQVPVEIGQSDGTTANYELGTSLQSDTPGQITGIRFWKDANETGTHTGHIWSSAGALLASVTFAGETASGWQQQALAAPLTIAANTTYVVSVNTGATYYVAATSGLASQVTNGNLHSIVGSDGLYGTSGLFPTSSYSSSNYFRDVLFVPGATYGISGNVSTNGSGATVTLSGAASATTTADGSGNYSFAGLANGSYTVTPSKSGYTFNPVSTALTISGANATADFTASAIPTYTISGSITPSASGSGVTIALSGAASASTTADGSGNYSFAGLANGSYTVTPSKSGFTFSPTTAAATVSDANVTVAAFAATPVPTYSISGTISPSASGSGATVALSGAASASTTADGSGNYSFAGMANGSYTVTPSKSGFTFSPANTPVTVSSANVANINFTATAVPLGQTLFTTQTPAITNASDGASANYELGMSFTSDTAGQISALRFWKASSESGTHTGKVWSSTGTLLASVTFAGETASGWQQQALAAPLSIAANTTYIVTVNTGNTYYVATNSGLASPIVSGNLHSVVGNNGLYGSTGLFPTSSWQSSNYFRDIVFVPGVTYSISGSITPNAGGSGATVTLSGAASASTTADASGNYTFAGLANGSYTVTPSKSGFTFSPTSAAATVNGANVTVAAFTATAVPTYSISGTISPGASGSGATVTLSGAASASTTADGSGNYTFAGLANGSYTITPSKSGFTFSPLNQAVTINSANVGAINFAAAALAGITIDATAFGDRSSAATSVTTSTFSTTASSELLLAMVGADVSTSSGTNNSVSSVTGGGLTWVLVRRTNTQRGTAEIWRAFATAPLSNVTVTANLTISAVSSITVMSIRGVNTSGTSGSGAIGNTNSGNGSAGTPTASLVTLGNNSLVVGVGEDWNAAPSVTAGPNQTLIHQLPLTNLNTFWTQRQNATTPVSGTTVTINDTAPTNHIYNLTICEILAAP